MSNPLYGIMGGFMALGLGLIGYGLATRPAHAQHPGNANYAPMANYAATVPNDGRYALRPALMDTTTICRNVLMQYPSGHLLLTARDKPELRIDCGDGMDQDPVHVTFGHLSDLMWYATHAGHRDVLEGEGPDD